MQILPPASDAFTILPALSFNSTNVGTVSEVGNGWSHLFRRYVSAVVPPPPGPGPPPPGPAGPPTVVTGAGQNYSYAATITGGYQTPTSNAVNSLHAGAEWSSFTETQPDGTFFQYGASGGVNNRAPLLYMQNAAGAPLVVDL